ncbi:MAG: flagellar hook-basal body complex protein FliE [Pseudomonadota bacterium]
MQIEPSFSSQLFDSARRMAPMMPEDQGGVGRTSFAEALTQAARQMEETLRTGEAAAEAAVSGQGDVQTVVEALTATELALETAVSVRDKVVEAYQEVLRMPV